MLQRLKEHHAVQPCQQFGAQSLFYRRQHPLFLQLPLFLPHKAAGLSRRHIGAQIGSEDDHRLPEADCLPGTVGQLSLLQNLQQHIEHIGMSLFHLIQQHHRAGTCLDPLGKLTSLSVAHIARRRTDEPGYRMFLQIFAHIQTDEPVAAGAKLLCQRLRQTGFAHAAGAAEQKSPPGSALSREGCPPQHGPGHLFHRLILSQHLFFQMGFQSQQPPVVLLKAFHALTPENTRHLLYMICRHPSGLRHSGAGRRFIHQIHRPVGVCSARHAGRCQLQHGFQRIVGNGHPVVLFVSGPQCPEDDIGIRPVGLPHLHRLKSAGKGAVPADVFFELRAGSCSDDLQTAPRQCRFQQIACVDGPLCRACTADGVQFVDEQNGIPCRPYLLQHGAHLFFKFPPVFGTCHHACKAQRHHPPPLQECRRLSGGNALGQAFHHGGFSYPCRSQQHRVAFLPAAQDLHYPVDLPIPAGHRIIFPGLCPGGHILAELHGQLELPAGAASTRSGLQFSSQTLPLSAAGFQHRQALGLLQQGAQQIPGGDGTAR